MDFYTLLNNIRLDSNSLFILNKPINGYKFSFSEELSTQLNIGRKFRIVNLIYLRINQFSSVKRIFIQSIEDRYFCWVNITDIDASFCKERIKSNSTFQIQNREVIYASIIEWIKIQARGDNSYLWGGSISPCFDCSGFIQTAFATHKIWLPRDAFQQEVFTYAQPIANIDLKNLEIGDLLFFGNLETCDHVGFYSGDNSYWHCSGSEFGHNGIALEHLFNSQNPISSYYNNKLRSVGKVRDSFQWDRILIE
tara:strand:- start:2069 stop:2824 length:756 start_codon:yes stop_codon:yes gene_type:complete